MIPLLSFFVCCVVAISSANTILSPIFGIQAGQHFDVLDQGRINHISWSLGVCGVFAIDDWDADSRMPDKETQFGTGGTAGTASDFTLGPDEYVTGVVAYFGQDCSTRVCAGLRVTTSTSAEYERTGLAEFLVDKHDQYPSLHNNSYYLSGWNVWVDVAVFLGIPADYIAGIQWQFTEVNTTPISPPTPLPTPLPTSASPTTVSPTTASPTTPSPTTTSPTTPSPTTASPTTPSPTTASPTTKSPTTSYPSLAPTHESFRNHTNYTITIEAQGLSSTQIVAVLNHAFNLSSTPLVIVSTNSDDHGGTKLLVAVYVPNDVVVDAHDIEETVREAMVQEYPDVEVRLTVEKDGSVQEQPTKANKFSPGALIALCVLVVLLQLCAFAGVYFWKFHRSQAKIVAQEPDQIDMAAHRQADKQPGDGPRIVKVESIEPGGDFLDGDPELVQSDSLVQCSPDGTGVTAGVITDAEDVVDLEEGEFVVNGEDEEDQVTEGNTAN